MTLRNLVSKVIRSPRIRNPLILSMYALGFLLLFIATALFSYILPQIDSKIGEINGKIMDSDVVAVQLELLQQEHWLPYNLVKMLDLSPNPPPHVKDSLAIHMKKTMMTMLGILCWPDNPTIEQQERWQAMNFIDMENAKRNLSSSFASRAHQLREQRLEATAQKESTLGWSTLCQSFGLLLTGLASVLRVLRKGHLVEKS